MSVKVQIVNADAVLNSLKKRLESGLQPALDAAKAAIEAKFQNNPPGWVPLKQATILQRQRLGFGAGPMLYRTGHLMGQAVQKVEIDSPTSGTLSTSDPIAIVQNKTRPFYQFSDQDKKAIFEAFKAGIGKGS